MGRNTTVTLQGVKKLEKHGKQFPGQYFVFTLSKVGEDGKSNQVDEQWVCLTQQIPRRRFGSKL